MTEVVDFNIDIVVFVQDHAHVDRMRMRIVYVLVKHLAYWIEREPWMNRQRISSREEQEFKRGFAELSSGVCSCWLQHPGGERMKRRTVVLFVLLLGFAILAAPIEAQAFSTWLRLNDEFNEPSYPALYNSDFKDGYYLDYWDESPTRSFYRSSSGGIGPTGDKECAIGRDFTGATITLYQEISSETTRNGVKGQYVKFSYWFRGYSPYDDQARAIIKYKRYSTSSWVTAGNSGWCTYQYNANAPWAEISVITSSALPTSLYRVRVEIQIRSTSDEATRGRVDKAALTVIHAKTGLMSGMGTGALAIEVNYLENVYSGGRYWRKTDLSIGGALEATGSFKYITGVSIRCKLMPLGTYWRWIPQFPYIQWVTVSEQFIGSHPFFAPVGHMQIWDDLGNARYTQGNDADPEIVVDPITEQSLIDTLIDVGELAATFGMAYIKTPTGSLGSYGKDGIWAITKSQSRTIVFDAIKSAFQWYWDGDATNQEEYPYDSTWDVDTYIFWDYYPPQVQNNNPPYGLDAFAENVIVAHGLTWYAPCENNGDGHSDWYIEVTLAVDFAEAYWDTILRKYVLSSIDGGTLVIVDRVYAF
ncbi:MAG: hypothetical protein AM324_013065 [Candidatus Thorarchaeota archaeon SMTZ1-83]|nr:MAG: hypothetical protein AM324_14205 [Candidatus Thorarchaeota archaeon SMTZ1-83]